MVLLRAAWLTVLLALPASSSTVDELSRVQSGSDHATRASTPEGASKLSGQGLDGKAGEGVPAVSTGELQPPQVKGKKPMPGFGRPLSDNPFSSPKPAQAPDGKETKGQGGAGEDEGGDEVAEAGFWMGFNLAMVPAYLLISENNFFSPFAYPLMLALLLPAIVIGLIGIVVAKIAVARATR